MLCYRHNGQRKMKNNKLELKDLKIEFPKKKGGRRKERKKGKLKSAKSSSTTLPKGLKSTT